LVHAIGDPKASLLVVTALQARQTLVQHSQSLECVRGELSQTMALTLLRDLDAMLAAVEQQRVARKSPYFDMGKRIDDAARLFRSDLEAEKARIKRLLGDYRTAEERRAREAAELARRELQRLAEERAAAELAAQQATTAKEAEAAQTKILEADLKAATAVMAPTQAPAQPENMKTRYKWVVEVLDLAALYKVFPDCVKLEPKMREIHAACARLAETTPEGQPVVMPGCKVSREIDVSAK
jgi:hypothetical protein